MLSFVYEALPSRVVFGEGSVAQLPEECDRLGIAKALVLCTPEQWPVAAEVGARLGARFSGIFDRAVMHVPAEIAEAARALAADLGADGCVAVGGGSTTGLAKAVALTSGLPVVAIPTTYAGSEMTPIWGITAEGAKKTGRDARVLPRTVIYDPLLSRTLPVALSVTSGMNAIAHCVEGLYAKDANPIVSLMAEEGIRAFAQALPVIVSDPTNAEARSRALYGAWLGGAVLGAVGMALHHKLCHTLGGSFNLPHAETHTVILPHATAFNAPETGDAMARVAKALGARDAAGGLWDLAAQLGAPLSLQQIGFERRHLERAADLAAANPYWNPRPVTRNGIRELLVAAYEGRRPQ